MASTVSRVRRILAQVIWTVAVVAALFLALGALLVALKANQDNALVTFVLHVADAVDVGLFDRGNGIKQFHGADAATKDAYAREELVAQLASEFLCQEHGIESQEVNSAAYLASWLRALQGDPRAVVVAASQAERTADWIMRRMPDA